MTRDESRYEQQERRDKSLREDTEQPAMSEHERAAASIFALLSAKFKERWAPKDVRQAKEFECNLTELLCAASRVAVSPFVMELRNYRDMVDLQRIMTEPAPVIKNDLAGNVSNVFPINPRKDDK